MFILMNHTRSLSKVTSSFGKKRAQSGFTLVELLIALAVAAILALIVVPSYQQIIMKSRRADAVVALTDLANRFEQYYSDNNTYATATIGAGATTDVLSNTSSPQGYYTLSILSSGTTATSYKIQATRKSTGSQANDTLCGNYTLTDQQVRTISGTGTLVECWPKN
jgi:type IV pilus assembly protein PilE